MSNVRPLMSRASAETLYEDFMKLDSDYWILDGAFREHPLFASATAGVSPEAFPETEHGVRKLITILEIKEARVPAVDFTKADAQIYNAMSNDFAVKKKKLTEARILFEGKEWYTYSIQPTYQIIGNQHNPGQKGYASLPTATPKRHKLIFTTKAATPSLMASTPTDTLFSKSLAADADIPHAHTRHKARGKSIGAVHNPSRTPHVPENLLILELNEKIKSNRKHFMLLLEDSQKEIGRLEGRIDDMNQSHMAGMAQKHRQIDDLKAMIREQNNTIANYRIALAPTGVRINEDTGKIEHGSTGKRVLEEIYEQDSGHELKRLKSTSHAGNPDLEHRKTTLGGSIFGRSSMSRVCENSAADCMNVSDQLPDDTIVVDD